MTLDALFTPRGIAVIGASGSPGKAGNALMHALAGYTGGLYPINPRGGVIAGHPAFPSVTDVGVPVDLAVLAVPPEAVPAALEDCGRAGVRAAVVCAGGFAEAGAAGAALQDRVGQLARRHGIRLLGPNTSGFVNPHDGVHATFLPAVTALPPGPTAIVAQSGGVNLALSFLAMAEGLGLRLGVGLGNAIDVGLADVLDHLATDEATTVVGLHVEGIGDGRALTTAVARLAAVKPVVALKVGRADVGDFARSHTGALTGSFALTRAALRQAGAVVVEDPTELVDALRALAAGRLPATARPGVGVLTGQAGPGLIVADSLRSAGVELPAVTAPTRDRLAELLPPLTYQRNPVDTGRPGSTFPEVAAAVAADPGIDTLVVYALDEPDALDPARTARALRAVSQAPVLFGSGGLPDRLDTLADELDKHGIPLYRSPDRLARAARALVVDSVARHRLSTQDFLGRGPGATERLDRGTLDEHQAKDLLAQAGLAVPKRQACGSRADAERALAELGGPVVVKALDATLTHKSDVGGVHAGVRSTEDLHAALDALDRLAAARDRPARYLVERQAPPGLELIVGGTRDAAYGPVVLLGVGGVGVEVAPDPVLRLAPLSPADALDMVAALPTPLLAGYRGSAPIDRPAVAAAIEAVATVLVSYEDITDVEVNPLRLTTEGALALDALIVSEQHAVEKEVHG